MINQAKVLQLTPLFPMYILEHCVQLQLSHGSVATDPVIWGILQHLTPCFKTFTALNLRVCGTKAR